MKCASGMETAENFYNTFKMTTSVHVISGIFQLARQSMHFLAEVSMAVFSSLAPTLEHRAAFSVS
jgi:hypothetical protein